MDKKFIKPGDAFSFLLPKNNKKISGAVTGWIFTGDDPLSKEQVGVFAGLEGPCAALTPYCNFIVDIVDAKQTLFWFKPEQINRKYVTTISYMEYPKEFNLEEELSKYCSFRNIQIIFRKPQE